MHKDHGNITAVSRDTKVSGILVFLHALLVLCSCSSSSVWHIVQEEVFSEAGFTVTVFFFFSITVFHSNS